MIEDPGTEIVGSPAFEIIDESRQYVLGAGDDFYGVWDKRYPDEPVQRFQAVDEGFDQAQTLFHELTRLEREERGALTPWIRTAILIAVGTWVATGVVFAAEFAGLFSEVIEHSLLQPLMRGVLLVDGVAFRIWVGGLAVLTALLLVATKHTGVSPDPDSAPSRLGLTGVVIGLVMWTIGGLIRVATTPEDPFGPGGFGATNLLATGMELLGFRLMIGAIIVTAYLWTRSRATATPAEEDV